MAHKLVMMEWLYKADQDFGFAQSGLSREERLYFDQLCFFFQQAAEKIQKIIRQKLDIAGEMTIEDIRKEDKKVDEELKTRRA